MERIGIAASKMAQGDLLKYNLFVIGISCLFFILLLLVCGFSVLVSMFVVSLFVRGFHWMHVVKMSMAVLGSVIGLLNLFAIIKNMKISKNKI